MLENGLFGNSEIIFIDPKGARAHSKIVELTETFGFSVSPTVVAMLLPDFDVLLTAAADMNDIVLWNQIIYSPEEISKINLVW